jgi:hypothetical protein
VGRKTLLHQITRSSKRGTLKPATLDCGSRVPTFQSPASSEEAINFVVNTLTPSQRKLLAHTLNEGVDSSEGVRINDCTANEATVRALMNTNPPLVREAGAFRYLTDLGVSVADYLASKGGMDYANHQVTIPSFAGPDFDPEFVEALESDELINGLK